MIWSEPMEGYTLIPSAKTIERKYFVHARVLHYNVSKIMDDGPEAVGLTYSQLGQATLQPQNSANVFICQLIYLPTIITHD